MSQRPYATSEQALVIARILMAPAVALGLLLSLAFALQPAAASEVAGYHNAVLQADETTAAGYVTPAGFKKHGHFKRNHGFKKHGAFRGHRAFKKRFVFKRHHGFAKRGIYKHGHGFRKGFFSGHRSFKGGFFTGHRRFH